MLKMVFSKYDHTNLYPVFSFYILHYDVDTSLSEGFLIIFKTGQEHNNGLTQENVLEAVLPDFWS